MLRHGRSATRARPPPGRTPGWCSPLATASMAARAAAESGARPRLVWMMTPVALMTGCSVSPLSLASRVHRIRYEPCQRRARSALPRCSRRAASSAARTASTTTCAPVLSAAAASAGLRQQAVHAGQTPPVVSLLASSFCRHQTSGKQQRTWSCRRQAAGQDQVELDGRKGTRTPDLLGVSEAL